jgi:hypothetical protein
MHHGCLWWMAEPASLFARTARAVPQSRRRQASDSAHTCTQEGVNVPTPGAAYSESIATHVCTSGESIARAQWFERGIGTTDTLMKGSFA